jgi:hypothetical protein
MKSTFSGIWKSLFLIFVTLGLCFIQGGQVSRNHLMHLQFYSVVLLLYGISSKCQHCNVCYFTQFFFLTVTWWPSSMEMLICWLWCCWALYSVAAVLWLLGPQTWVVSYGSFRIVCACSGSSWGLFFSNMNFLIALLDRKYSTDFIYHFQSFLN